MPLGLKWTRATPPAHSGMAGLCRLFHDPRLLAADPPAYGNDRGDDRNQHDSEQHGVLDERRALFVLA